MQALRTEVADLRERLEALEEMFLPPSPGDWRCGCPPGGKFDKSWNPPHVGLCTACGERRPASDDRGDTGP